MKKLTALQEMRYLVREFRLCTMALNSLYMNMPEGFPNEKDMIAIVARQRAAIVTADQIIESQADEPESKEDKSVILKH